MINWENSKNLQFGKFHKFFHKMRLKKLGNSKNFQLGKFKKFDFENFEICLFGKFQNITISKIRHF